MATALAGSDQLVLSELRKGLSSIPEVLRAYTEFRGNTLHAWILVDSYEQPVRKRIFSIEQKLIQLCHELDFDFYVVAKPASSSLDEIVSDAAITYTRIPQPNGA